MENESETQVGYLCRKLGRKVTQSFHRVPLLYKLSMQKEKVFARENDSTIIWDVMFEVETRLARARK